MKRNISIALTLCVAGGCFGDPTATPSALVEVAASQTQEPAVTPESTAISSKSPPLAQPVVAQDQGMTIAGVTVGDPALESAVQFSVNRAGTVLVRPESSGELRLFRVQTDQFGQTELVGELPASGAVEVSLSSPGTYLVAGEEKSLPFADVPLGGIQDSSQYKVQATGCSASASHVLQRSYGGYPATIFAWTKDTEFPPKIAVYIHRGIGNSDDPVDSFQNWVDYNRTRSPDKAALAERVRAYPLDLWDSAPAPDVGADAFNARRINCGTKGELWLDVCHSAGCNETRLALLQESFDRWNNIGAVAVAPAFGGSHLAIKDLFDTSISTQHKPVRFSIVRAIVQREWGLLLPKRFLPQEIIADRRALYSNRGLRALAWTGVGTGIPTLTYAWFSPFEKINIPFLKLRLKPQARYTMPADNTLNEYAPKPPYISPEDGEMFNYIEAINAFDQQTGYRDISHVTNGKFDVAICYLGGDLRPAVRSFEKKYAQDDSLLELLWRVKTDRIYREQFIRDALPWLASLTARAPSVVPSNPKPNENSAGDGTLTFCQQLGCDDGLSILAPESEYGKLIINKGAANSRKPYYVDAWEGFPGRHHKDAVSGDFDDDGKKDGDQTLWNWMNSRVIARVNRQWDQERNYVLTEKDKKRIMDTFGPTNGEEAAYSDWEILNPYVGGIHMTKTVYRLSQTNTEWIQDPLVTGQRSRIRLIGTGTMTTDIYRYSKISNEYIFDYKATASRKWEVTEDFIARNGILQLVVIN